MAGGQRGDRARFTLAGPGQVADVLMVLDEAAAWLRGRGITQWPPRFERSWVEGSVGRGETWLVTVDGQVSATVTLDLADPVWDGAAGDALYVHRMAVRRRSAGLGAVILDWAAATARGHGRRALRLDCVASNARLRAYYEAAGFAHRGDVTVVSRYELLLEPGGATGHPAS